MEDKKKESSHDMKIVYYTAAFWIVAFVNLVIVYASFSATWPAYVPMILTMQFVTVMFLISNKMDALKIQAQLA